MGNIHRPYYNARKKKLFCIINIEKNLKKLKYLDASEHLLFDDDYDEHIPALDDQSLFSPVRYKRKKL